VFLAPILYGSVCVYHRCEDSWVGGALYHNSMLSVNVTISRFGALDSNTIRALIMVPKGWARDRPLRALHGSETQTSIIRHCVDV